MSFFFPKALWWHVFYVLRDSALGSLAREICRSNAMKANHGAAIYSSNRDLFILANDTLHEVKFVATKKLSGETSAIGESPFEGGTLANFLGSFVDWTCVWNIQYVLYDVETWVSGSWSTKTWSLMKQGYQRLVWRCIASTLETNEMSPTLATKCPSSACLVNFSFPTHSGGLHFTCFVVRSRGY